MSDIGTAAMWLALGGWFVASTFTPYFRDREVQRTIRALIERDGTIDSETLELIRGAQSASGNGGSGVTGRQLFAAAILIVGFLFGGAVMSALIVERPGWQPSQATYAAGIAIFAVSTVLGGFVAYRIGRTPRQGGS